MTSTWIDILAADRHKIQLPELRITFREHEWVGSGEFSWTSDSGLRLTGLTDGGQFLSGHVGSPCNAKVGELYGDDDYATPVGSTIDGWDVFASPFLPQGYRVSTGSDSVFWDARPQSLWMTRTSQGPDSPRSVQALFAPAVTAWTRPTNTTVENESFCNRKWDVDWLLCTTAIGDITARRRSDQAFEVRIDFRNEESQHEVRDILLAVARAFGFLLGKRVHLLGSNEVSVQTETRRLNPRRKRDTRMTTAAPLGDGGYIIDQVENFLSKAIDVFLTDVGKAAADYLAVCWDAVDNDWSTRFAISCIALEGLLYEVTKKHTEDEELTKQVNVLTEHVDTLHTDGQLSEAFVNRVKGAMRAWNMRRPVDVLNDWKSRGILDVTSKDIEAFNKVRNRGAHGGLIGPLPDRAELQKLINRHKRVENLINRVLLQLMGFSGKYIDYSKSGYPAVDFPLTELENL